MDRGMTFPSREKQLGINRGKWGGEGAFPQSPPYGGLTGDGPKASEAALAATGAG